LACVLSVSLFLFWAAVGWCVATVLGSGRNLVRNALMAPVVGAAVTVLPLVWMSRAGLPVRESGPVVALLEGVFCLLVLYRFRWPFPMRRLIPFAVILGVAFLITGYPLIRFGFDWVGSCNDDMANFALSAQGFLNHGFFQLPDQRLLLENRDASLNLWFLYALAGVRPGSELVLAWVMSCTGLSAHQIYMPTILALHLALIAAASALVLENRRFTTAALVVSGLISCSALTSYATANQLLPQVFGLSLLAATGCLVLRPLVAFSGARRLRQAVLTGILGAATGVVYPEVTPFLLLAAALYHFIAVVQRRESVKRVLKVGAVIAAFGVIFLNTFIPSTISFLLEQAGRSLSPVGLEYSLFPYFLVPSGFGNFWGFLPIGRQAPAGIVNVAIAAGMVLFAVCAAGAVWQAWRGRPAPTVCVIMLALSVELFRKQNDFGIFKLAMYLQPFFLSSAVLSWFGVIRREQ
jgi:hypothetical protein